MQLTSISHRLFSKIEIKELLGSQWTKRDKYVNSPHVMKIIDRFNKLTLWVVEEILSYDKRSMRTLVIEKFIKIANECRKLSNFNDCMNIVCALNNFILRGMTLTWRKLSGQSKDLFNQLNLLCSYENNYALLRSEEKKKRW